MGGNIFNLGERKEIQMFTRKRRSASSSSQNNNNNSNVCSIANIHSSVMQPVEIQDNSEKPINLIIKNTTMERSLSQNSMRDLLNHSVIIKDQKVILGESKRGRNYSLTNSQS
jgi:hypothetical protein